MSCPPTITRPLDALTVHPLLRPVPRLALDAPEMASLMHSVESLGITTPLAITERDELINGRARLVAAHKAGLADVPCQVFPDADAAAMILDDICARRLLTKSSRAYLAFPLLDTSEESRRQAQLRGLMAGRKARVGSPLSTAWTTEQVAAAHGFGRSLFYQAKETHRLFNEQPEYREQMEGPLLAGDVSLQGVLAGWTGLGNKGKPRGQSDQLDLFGNAFRALRFHFTRTWNGMNPERRLEALTPEVRETVAEMPPEVRRLFAAEIRAQEKALREQPSVVAA